MTMTRIETMEDVIAALESSPALLDRVRLLIMTERVLELPERFERMLETQNRLIEELKELRETQNRTLEVQQDHSRRIRRLEGRVANLNGAEYQRKAAAQTAAAAQYLYGVENPETVIGDGAIPSAVFNRMAAGAQEKGMDPESITDLFRADLAVLGSNGRHLVAEVSLNPDRDDGERAISRALAMNRIAGGETAALVLSPEFSPEAEEDIRATGAQPVSCAQKRHKFREEDWD